MAHSDEFKGEAMVVVHKDDEVGDWKPKTLEEGVLIGHFLGVFGWSGETPVTNEDCTWICERSPCWR